MAGSDGLPDPAEQRVLGRLRAVTVTVILILIVLLVVTDTIGRLALGADFHTSDIFLGMLIGALLPLLGVVGIIRGGPKNGS